MIAHVGETAHPVPAAPDQSRFEDTTMTAAPKNPPENSEPDSFLLTLLRALGAIHS
jgi:hypothetical protein